MVAGEVAVGNWDLQPVLAALMNSEYEELVRVAIELQTFCINTMHFLESASCLTLFITIPMGYSID